MEIFFPHDKFPTESSHREESPLLNPSPQPKNPPENARTLSNNHYYM